MKLIENEVFPSVDAISQGIPWCRIQPDIQTVSDDWKIFKFYAKYLPLGNVHCMYLCTDTKENFHKLLENWNTKLPDIWKYWE